MEAFKSLFLFYNVHPVFSSLPFAFFSLLIAVELISYFSVAGSLRVAVDVLIPAIGIAVLLAFFSGYQGAEFVQTGSEALNEAVAVHHRSGKILLFFLFPFIGVFYAARYASQNQKAFRIIYLLLLVVCYALVIRSGFLGGDLVFSHGAGVA